MKPGLAEAIRSVRLVCFDFDGVFTDNRVIVDEDGREAVICSRADGLGLAKLRQLGVPMVVVSKETNPVVQRRCHKLQLECYSGCDDKLTKLSELARERGFGLSEIAYVGNDINDIECLSRVGLPVCVNDAYPEVKAKSSWILTRKGGDGAVREFCDVVFQSRAGS